MEGVVGDDSSRGLDVAVHCDWSMVDGDGLVSVSSVAGLGASAVVQASGEHVLCGGSRLDGVCDGSGRQRGVDRGSMRVSGHRRQRRIHTDGSDRFYRRCRCHRLRHRRLCAVDTLDANSGRVFSIDRRSRRGDGGGAIFIAVVTVAEAAHGNRCVSGHGLLTDGCIRRCCRLKREAGGTVLFLHLRDRAAVPRRLGQKRG